MVKIPIRSALLALMVLPLVTGCTTTPTPATTTPSTSSSTASSTAPTSPSPSSSLTPTTSPADHELTSAQQAVVTLWATVARLTNDPRLSLQALDSVATDSALTMFQENLGQYRADRWVGSGSYAVTDLQVVPSGVDARGYRAWTVTACVDGSKTTLVDQSGKSVQGPPYRIRHKATVISRASHLYVSTDTAVGTC